MNFRYNRVFYSCIFNGSRYTLHGVKLRDRSDQRILFELQAELNVDLWEHGAPGLDRDVTMMLSPDNKMKVLDILDANGIAHYIVDNNVAK